MKVISIAAVVLLLSICVHAQTLIRAEYFFDSDPGQGNGTALSVVSGATVNQTFNISIGSLSTGFHTLNTRVRSNSEVWSLSASRIFYIIPSPIASAPATQIVSAEFFIDADPGIGNGTPVSFSPAATKNFLINVPVTSLSHGFHTINVRTKDNRGVWSLFSQRSFYVVPPVGDSGPSTSILEAEYFFDNDPGVGNATALPITAGALQSNLFSLDVSGITPGFHRIGIRYRDNQFRWSHFVNRSFYVISGNLATSSAITQLEYFIDANPDFDASLNGTGVPVTPSATIDQDIFIDISGIPSGTHVLYVRARDDKGFWSTVKQGNFTIQACTPPSIPTALAVARCGSGVIELVASGASGSQVYRWYEDPTTSTILFTGEEFETPALSASRNYFVSIFDPVSLCESNRVGVTASVLFATKPVVSPPGQISFCEGSSIVLSAPIGFQQYVWSTGETTRQIFVNKQGKYAVQTGDGNCLSPASDTTAVSVINALTKPVISPSGPLTFCNGGSVVLSAPAGFSQYIWSTGETTQQITATTNGSYSVKVGNGSCLSVASDNVVISVANTLSEPVITVSGPISFCQGGSVNLSAPSGFAQYVWSTGESTEQITVTTAGNFSVRVGNGICLSAESDKIPVVVTNIPAKPIVTPSGSVSFCDGGSVILSAPAGFSRYAWNSGETTRQIFVNAAGTYSVQTGEGNCLSIASDATQVTVNSAASKPVVSVAGNTTICGSGSVTMTGPSGFNYLWSNGETTQSITASASGVYTLRISTPANCLSTASDPVAVTVLTPPCGAVAVNQSPVINNAPLASPIEGQLTLDLTTIITDPDANLDFASLKLLSARTSRGASAIIDASYNLIVDYSGLPFTGTDRITIEICDLAGACVQQVFDIDVVGAVVVYNGVSPDGDGKNDFLLLKYVDVVQGAEKNKVTIFNRWGDVVFQITDYNNLDRSFAGLSNNGSELPSGTYFYKAEFASSLEPLTGFLTLKR
jgi:gliding motility-associated-like protein